MLFSVITINKNNIKGLIKTIDSVISQNYYDFEFIIIDGKSNDGSIEYVSNINYPIKYISEEDNGIYDAMNKGITISSGRYLIFLNSGDHFISNEILSKISNTVSTSKGTNIFYGDYFEYFAEPILKKLPKKISLFYFRYNFINHQSCFIDKTLFQRFGMYNVGNKYVSDWEFFVLCKLNKIKFIHLMQPISNYDPAGISSMNQIQCRRELEERWSAIVPFPKKLILEPFYKLHIIIWLLKNF